MRREGGNVSTTILDPITEPDGIPAPTIFSGESVNKRKRVALAKRRTKKRKLKARAQTAR
jgi:hypothetical protein